MLSKRYCHASERVVRRSTATEYAISWRRGQKQRFNNTILQVALTMFGNIRFVVALCTENRWLVRILFFVKTNYAWLLCIHEYNVYYKQEKAMCPLLKLVSKLHPIPGRKQLECFVLKSSNGCAVDVSRTKQVFVWKLRTVTRTQNPTRHSQLLASARSVFHCTVSYYSLWRMWSWA